MAARTCERHPLTLTQAGDLDLTVALVDSSGHVSRIKLGALSEGVIEPYPRAGGTKTGLRFTCIDNHKTCLYPAGCNETMSQSGWQAEFETIRIRLMDFLTNATLLNLKQVSAIRFEMGGTAGDSVGRVTLDDLELSAN